MARRPKLPNLSSPQKPATKPKRTPGVRAAWRGSEMPDRVRRAMAQMEREAHERPTVVLTNSKEKSSRSAGPGPVAMTLRLDPAVRRGLEALQQTLGTPMNKLVNLAVADFVATKTRDIESELEAALTRMKALRRADPTFAGDFAEVIAAEIMYRDQDPIEGVAFREDPDSAVSMVRRMLSGRT